MFDFKPYTNANTLRADLEQDFNETHPEPVEPVQPVLTRPQVVKARNNNGGEQPRLWVEVRNYESDYYEAELVLCSTSSDAKVTKLPPAELAMLITEMQRGSADLQVALAYQADLKIYKQLKSQRNEQGRDYVNAVVREWRSWQQGTVADTPAAQDFDEDYDEEDYDDEDED